MEHLKKVITEFDVSHNLLIEAKATLKTEFIGIDEIIDEIIAQVTSWLFLSELQNKPFIINIWGYTGAGKTTLVERLIELIAFEKKSCSINLNSKNIKKRIVALQKIESDAPLIITIDELEKRRSLFGPFKKKIYSNTTNAIWELIKTGSVGDKKKFKNVLIFVIGNVDEIYRIENKCNTKHKMDTYRNFSKKLTMKNVRSFFERRYTDEQMINLGTINYIFPTLSKKAYLQLIKNELDDFALQLFEIFNIETRFSNSIINIIFSEIEPLQGIKTIQTSIQQLIKVKLYLFYKEIIRKSIIVNSLFFSSIDNKLLCTYFNDDREIHKKLIKNTTI